MPGIKCGGCGRFTSNIDGAKCGKCQAHYHRACVGVQMKANLTSSWRCPECKKNITRDNRAETPVRGAIGSPQLDISGDQVPAEINIPTNLPTLDLASTPRSVADSSPHNMVTHGEPSPIANSGLTLIMEELKAVRAEIQGFRKEMEVEMAGLKATLNTCNKRIDGLEARVNVLEQQALLAPSNSVCVDKVVEELRRELNDRDQELLANDIELSNMPEDRAENPVHIMKSIGLKLGVNLEDRDIVSAERMGGRQINATNPNGPSESRPRVIVVRLARRDLRDQLLESARVRRGATTTDLGLPGPAQRFYLNERLTKTNRQLFRRARDAASVCDWRFVWTRRGRILARRRPGDKTQRICTEEDISRVFGPVSDTA